MVRASVRCRPFTSPRAIRSLPSCSTRHWCPACALHFLVPGARVVSMFLTGLLHYASIAFSALTLLVGHQEKHPSCKNWVTRCWCGCLSRMRCKWFAYSPADATATSSSLASLKSRMVSPFWCRLTQVVLERGWPLNGVCLSECQIVLSIASICC